MEEDIPPVLEKKAAKSKDLENTKSLKMGWKGRRKIKKKGRKAPPYLPVNQNLKSCLKPSSGLFGSMSDTTSTCKDFSLASGLRYAESHSSTSSKSRSDSASGSRISRSRHSDPRVAIDYPSDKSRSDSASGSKGSKGSRSRQSEPQSVPNSHNSQSASGSRSRQRKLVRFDNIYIRHYPRIVGDNPSCSDGPPISIGWAHGETEVLSLNSYEEARQKHRSPQQAKVLSRIERELLLQSWDVPDDVIIQANRNNIRAKFQRRQTVRNLRKVERLEIVFQGAAKALKRSLNLRRRTDDELKELQAQANLAARALEQARLHDLIGDDVPDDNEDTISISEAEGDYNFENMKVQVSEHCKSYPLESMVLANGGANGDLPEDDAASLDGLTLGNTTISNSTSASVKEMERFYKELEREMFGAVDESSLLGRTLEVPSSSEEGAQDDDGLSISSSLPSRPPQERRANTFNHRTHHPNYYYHQQRPAFAPHEYYDGRPLYPISSMQYAVGYGGYSLNNAYGVRSSTYYMPQGSMGMGQHSQIPGSYSPVSPRQDASDTPFWRQTIDQEEAANKIDTNEPEVKHRSPAAHEPVTIRERPDEEHSPTTYNSYQPQAVRHHYDPSSTYHC